MVQDDEEGSRQSASRGLGGEAFQVDGRSGESRVGDGGDVSRWNYWALALQPKSIAGSKSN